MFFKKIICQKCKKKLSKKEFASFSNENICMSCYLKEEEKKEKRKIEQSIVNWQYIENNKPPESKPKKGSEAINDILKTMGTF